LAVYLQVCAGPLYLMLSAEGVHEVTTLDQLGQSERGFVEWRHTVLPLVRLSSFFELAPSYQGVPERQEGGAESAPVVVYSPADEAQPLAFELDSVIWLKDLPAQSWLALPAVPARTAYFFDAIMSFPGSEHQAYRLKRPLRHGDFRSAGAWMLASEAVLEGELKHE